MKIADIRRAIDSLYYTIRDLQGHTRDEFLARDVPGVLMGKINELNAIEVKPRFEHEIVSRINAISSAHRQIKMWYDMRSAQAQIARLDHISRTLNLKSVS